MNGMVTGGWGFVVAAYALTAIALVSYGVMVITGLSEGRRRAETERKSRMTS